MPTQSAALKAPVGVSRKHWPWILFAIIVGVPVLGCIFLIMVGVLSEKSGSSYLSAPTTTESASFGSTSGQAERSPGVAYDLETTASGNIIDVTSDGQTVPTVEQKILKSGSLSLVVKNTDTAISEITTLAQERAGFVLESESYSGADGTLLGSIVIRVPADQFEQMLLRLKNGAELVESEQVSGVDVTEEFIDLQARLGNAQALETNYIVLLDKSGTIEDTLKVTKQLSIVREEIEILQGRIRYLEARTDFSTISVFLRERPSIVSGITQRYDVFLVFQEAFRMLVRFAQSALTALIWLVVFVGPIFILVWIVWKIARGAQRRHAKK